ncbi:MAG: MerR family transcriptional regulator [Pseudomonadota bacterium]|nr:MerR family transcriptional regulator [Pseudomonadota bacterium]
MTQEQPDSDNGLFPIRTVSTRTGVNAVTLRAWERRYGLLRPQRTAKGHRIYSQTDIDLVHQVVALLNKGMAISQVKNHLDSQPQTQPGSGPWGDYQQRILEAVIDFDDQALERCYNEALSLYPIDMVTRQLITPLLLHLGTRWASTTGSIAEEHFFGAYLRNKLGARFHHEANRARGPKLLAACLPGEHHEVGLLLVCLSLMSHGYRIVLLGGDTPLEELPLPASRSSAAAIILSSAIDPATDLLEKQLPQLVRTLTIPVYIGGPTSLRHHNAIQQAGAISLGTDIQQALTQISATLKTDEDRENPT